MSGLDNRGFLGISISERFRQFYFFTKRSTLLVKNTRKTKFLHSFSIEQNAKFLPFFVYATFFEKEVRYFELSSEWYFDVNIVRSSSISHFTRRCFKSQKRYLSSRGGTGYAVSLRGNSINFRGNTLTQITSCISLR